MSYRLGVDLGTTFTAAAWANGRGPALVGLGNRALQVPSVLYLDQTGEFVVGEAAERRGNLAPERVAREFKRRIGDHVPILIAGAAFSPENLTARLLSWTVRTATTQLGGPPGEVVLTHPANWGSYKLELFEQVAAMADVGVTRRLPEPVAAAAQYAANTRVQPGDRIAVYDLGGGTFDVCVLQRTANSFQVLGKPEGIEHLGGIDFDEATFRLVWAGLGERVSHLDFTDPATTVAVARLRRDVIDAKEALSTDTEVFVPVGLPGFSTTHRVTRGEFESVIRPAIDTTVEAMRRALRSAGVQPAQLRAIVLIGGSSRIPLVSQALQREFRVAIAIDTHPKHDVALGALLMSESPTPAGLGWSTASPASPAGKVESGDPQLWLTAAPAERVLPQAWPPQGPAQTVASPEWPPQGPAQAAASPAWPAQTTGVAAASPGWPPQIPAGTGGPANWPPSVSGWDSRFAPTNPNQPSAEAGVSAKPSADQRTWPPGSFAPGRTPSSDPWPPPVSEAQYAPPGPSSNAFLAASPPAPAGRLLTVTLATLSTVLFLVVVSISLVIGLQWLS